MATVITTTFELTGADGGPLRGDVRAAEWGADRPALVICHGFKGFKDWGFFPQLAHRLAHAGFTAVSFNFTGSGVGPDGQSFSESERFSRATFSGDLEDINIVCREVAAGTLIDGLARPTRLGLFGHSRGGGMAAVHAARTGGVEALVTWSAIGTVRRWPEATLIQWRREGKIDVPNARTGDILSVSTDLLDDIERHQHGDLDILAAAAAIQVPWLMIHGDADATVPLSEARSLHDGAGHGVELRVVPGGTHTMGVGHPWAGSTPEMEFAIGETVAWFSNCLF